MRRPVARLFARGVHLTHLIDTAYRRFDRLRSAFVIAFGSDHFFDEYNAVTYAGSAWYRPDSAVFRRHLFEWEETVVERFFPAPPARVLVGGAGGGREALALVARDYSVVAFDPAAGLVNALRARARGDAKLRAYCGNYTTLPHLVDPATGADVNLAQEAPFDASIVGWASFSHLRSDTDRFDTLMHFSRLTRGPVLVSYYPPLPQSSGSPAGRLETWIRKRMARRGHSVFSIDIGYYRLLSHDEVADLVSRTSLKVLHAQTGGNWPYVVIEGGGEGASSPRSPKDP